MITRKFLLTLALCYVSTAAFTQTFDVEIKNLAYNPQNLTIPAGATVRWTNNETLTSHTVTADDFSFDSGILGRGQQFSRTFTTPGVYPYHCELHFTMSGTITVTSNTTEVSPTGFTIARGKLISGGLAALLSSDDSRMEVRMGPVTGTESPVEVDVTATSPTTTGTQLKITVELQGSRTGLTQLVYMRNFQTDQWDLLDSRAATTTDTSIDITVTGSANVAKYIKASDGSMAVKIGLRSALTGQPKLFSGKLDRVHWSISP